MRIVGTQVRSIDTRPLVPTKVGSLQLGMADRDGRTWVSAASGIAAVAGTTWVVSDEYGELAKFGSLVAPGALVPGLAHAKSKPDLESLVAIPDHDGSSLLVAFGSGSAKKGSRDGALVQRLDVSGARLGQPIRASLEPLYHELAKQLPMGVNVEGLAVRDTAHGAELLVFHRGRLPGDRNVVFRLDATRAAELLARGEAITTDVLLGSTDIDLGTLAGAPLGLSDAKVLADGRIVFAASAESLHKKGSNEDGAILGSAVGVLDTDLRVQSIHPLVGTPRKVEGIMRARDMDPAARANEFVLVTDPDDPQAASEVLRVNLES